MSGVDPTVSSADRGASLGSRVAVGLIAIVVVGVLLGSALAPSHTHGRSGGVASRGPRTVANPLAGRMTTMVGTDVPAARFGEEMAAPRGFRRKP